MQARWPPEVPSHLPSLGLTSLTSTGQRFQPPASLYTTQAFLRRIYCSAWNVQPFPHVCVGGNVSLPTDCWCMSFGFKYVFVTIFWKEGSLQSTYYIYYILLKCTAHIHNGCAQLPRTRSFVDQVVPELQCIEHSKAINYSKGTTVFQF